MCLVLITHQAVVSTYQNFCSPHQQNTVSVPGAGTTATLSTGLGTQVTQSLTRTIVSTPIMTTTTSAASQEAAAAIEAMEAENAEAIEGLPMQVMLHKTVIVGLTNNCLLLFEILISAS